MDDEPTDDADAPFELFDGNDEEEGPAPAGGWLGAIGQMIAAVLVVATVVALFVGAAVALRRLLP